MRTPGASRWERAGDSTDLAVPADQGTEAGFRVDLNPEQPTFFKDLYKETRIRNPKKIGYSGLR